MFLNSPYRETPKNVIKKNREKVGFGLLVEFFVKTFRHDFFGKTFFVVFLNSNRWKTPENAIKQKKSRKNWHRNFCRNFWKGFRHGLFAKIFLWCFWTPLAGDWLIPGFSRPTAEKEGRAGGGSTSVRSYVGGPKTSARPPVSSPIGPRTPNPRGPSQVPPDQDVKAWKPADLTVDWTMVKL